MGRIEISLNRPPATYTLPQLPSLYRQLEEGINGIARGDEDRALPCIIR